MTKWVGDACDQLFKSGKLQRYFEKTGCLLRVDGSDIFRDCLYNNNTFKHKQDFIIRLDTSLECDSDNCDSIPSMKMPPPFLNPSRFSSFSQLSEDNQMVLLAM